MIKKNPKMFVGFSDGTTLVNAIYAKTGLMTYMGPDLMWTFGKPMDKAVEENLRNTFFEGKVGQLKPNSDWKHRKQKDLKKPRWKCIRPGKASGVLVGGHLGVVCGNILAGYFPETRGKILILEGTEEMAQLDWYLHAMRLNGAFDGLRGIVLGFFDGSEMVGMKNQPKISEVVLEATKGYKFPILEMSDLGHNIQNYAFPIGGRVTIDAKKKYLSVDGRTAK
jgi:muramoyltetrapeptide carboxypeptidase